MLSALPGHVADLLGQRRVALLLALAERDDKDSTGIAQWYDAVLVPEEGEGFSGDSFAHGEMRLRGYDRADGAEIHLRTDGGRVPTGRRKLGAILGDGVEWRVFGLGTVSLRLDGERRTVHPGESFSTPA